MNKYQKQAIVDMLKVTATVLVGIVLAVVTVRAGMEASDLVGGLSVLGMCYCVYQLYLIRVGQLESADRLSAMEDKYK